MQRYGWAAPFYVFGAVGVLWLILWFQQVENDPVIDSRLGAEYSAAFVLTAIVGAVGAVIFAFLFDGRPIVD